MNYKTLKIEDESSTLEVFINKKNNLVISISPTGQDESNIYYSGLIELDVNDIDALIDELKELNHSIIENERMDFVNSEIK